MQDLTQRQNKVPGEPGLWVILLGDMLIFGLFFLTYLYYRSENPALYIAAQDHLNRVIGLSNTLILLTSSWFVASAVRAAQEGRRASVRPLLAGAIVLGLAFVVLKFVEYGEKISAGITIGSNEFYIYYFCFTGIHLVHVVIGLAVLAYLLAKVKPGTARPNEIALLEGGGAFWHLVDLLWVVLFALFYLVR